MSKCLTFITTILLILFTCAQVNAVTSPLPQIQLAGYLSTKLTTRDGGVLTLWALACDLGDNSTVDLYYQGVPTGLKLPIVDSAGIYSLSLSAEPGVPVSRVLLELVGLDSAGESTAPWPYLNVADITHASPTPGRTISPTHTLAPTYSSTPVATQTPTAPPTETASPLPSFTATTAYTPTHTLTPLPTFTPLPSLPKRVLVMGDSWSVGLAAALKRRCPAAGFNVNIDYNLTARAGSTAEDWVANEYPPGYGSTQPRMLDGLRAKLHNHPPAAAVVMTLGGNDLNEKASQGMGEWPDWFQRRAFDNIESDIESVIAFIRNIQPTLPIVICSYDYLHFEFLVAFGLKLDGFTRRSYNEAFVELGRRQWDITKQRLYVYWVHNFGLLQHLHGDTIHPPFPCPNPYTGYPEYPPGFAPKPGGPPSYWPLPGGLIDYPAPLDWMPDGIHPSPGGFDDITDNILEQALEDLLK